MSSDEKQYVIDTFAWIEYFSGSVAGKRAKQYIESDRVYTPTIVISELVNKYLKHGVDLTDRLRFIRLRTTLIPLDDELAETAGRIQSERKKTAERWGIVDSIILATARTKGGKVVTGDEHFRDLKLDTVMIK